MTTRLILKTCFFTLMILAINSYFTKSVEAFYWEDNEWRLEEGEEKLTLQPGESVFIPMIYHFIVEGEHKQRWRSLSTGEELPEQNGASEYANWDGEITGNMGVNIRNTSTKPILLFGKLGEYELKKVKPSILIKEIDNTDLMLKTGITVGMYNFVIFNKEQDPLTIRFRNASQVADWLIPLYGSIVLKDGYSLINQKKFWERFAEHEVLKGPVDFLLNYGALATFEQDNGYNLQDASIKFTIKNFIEDIPVRLRDMMVKEISKHGSLESEEFMYKLISGDTPEIAWEIEKGFEIDFNKSEEVRKVLFNLLIEKGCPNYVWEQAIFKCNGKNFAKMPVYGNGNWINMHINQITALNSIDLQFSSEHYFPKVGKQSPPEFNVENLKLFILDTYNLLTNKKPETILQSYVKEVYDMYTSESLYEYFKIKIPNQYKDRVIVDNDTINSPEGYNYQAVNLSYNDTSLLKDKVLIVRIEKYSRKIWGDFELTLKVGPHQRIIKEDDWVYVWDLPGEHPYEPYGTDQPEAKEYLKIFEEFYAILEEKENNGSSGTLEWPLKENIDTHHNWTIKFNDLVNEKTVNNKNFNITLKGKQITDIKVSLNADGETVNIQAPKEGYKIGEIYTLHISDSVQSITNNYLSQSIEMNFKIGEQAEPLPEVNWEGEWKRELPFHNGVLQINQVQSSTFDFTLHVSSGTSVDFIEGKADFVGNKASFSDPDSNCKLTFTHNEDSITIEQSMDCIRIATFFSGEFELNPVLVEVSLYPFVIDSQTVNEKFRELTKADYQLFYDSMQLVSRDGYDNEVKGTVVSGAVRGLFTFMEAVIVIGDDGHLYGAVISNQTIHYYTSNQKYNNKLPQSITDWMKGFNYYKVEYLSS